MQGQGYSVRNILSAPPFPLSTYVRIMMYGYIVLPHSVIIAALLHIAHRPICEMGTEEGNAARETKCDVRMYPVDRGHMVCSYGTLGVRWSIRASKNRGAVYCGGVKRTITRSFISQRGVGCGLGGEWVASDDGDDGNDGSVVSENMDGIENEWMQVYGFHASQTTSLDHAIVFLVVLVPMMCGESQGGITTRHHAAVADSQ
jgi:hypothetical protein